MDAAGASLGFRLILEGVRLASPCQKDLGASENAWPFADGVVSTSAPQGRIPVMQRRTILRCGQGRPVRMAQNDSVPSSPRHIEEKRRSGRVIRRVGVLRIADELSDNVFQVVQDLAPKQL